MDALGGLLDGAQGGAGADFGVTGQRPEMVVGQCTATRSPDALQGNALRCRRLHTTRRCARYVPASLRPLVQGASGTGVQRGRLSETGLGARVVRRALYALAHLWKPLPSSATHTRFLL